MASSRFEGWPLVAWTAGAVGAMVAAIVAPGGVTEESLRAVLRATARVSVVLFSLAFAASALRRLWRNAATAWILRNRRQLGVSFAVSHAYHLAAILSLAFLKTPERFIAEAGPVIVFGGGVGYLLIAAMTATSFDRSAAWLGPRWWKRLHRAGMYGLGAFFAVTYAPAPFVRGWIYVPFALVALAAPALRVVAALRKRG